MKKFYQFSSFGLIVGLLLILVGWANNGIKTVVANDNNTTFTVVDGKAHTKKLTDQTDVNEIEINVLDSDVYIHNGNQNKVTVTCINPGAIKARVSNKKLIISGSTPVGIVLSETNSKIDISVPKHMKKIILEAGSNSGNITVENFKASCIVLMSYTGKINVTNSDVASSVLNTKKGQLVTVNNSNLGYSDIEMKGGQLKIKNSRLRANARTTSSNITVTKSNLFGNSSFNMKKGGDFKISDSNRLSYQLSSFNRKEIKYHDSKMRGRFSKKNSSKNSLQVNNDDGAIVVK